MSDMGSYASSEDGRNEGLCGLDGRLARNLELDLLDKASFLSFRMDNYPKILKAVQDRCLSRLIFLKSSSSIKSRLPFRATFHTPAVQPPPEPSPLVLQHQGR